MSTDEMKVVIVLTSLFLVGNTCEDFWQNWRNVSCLSNGKECYISKDETKVEIYDQSLSILCNNHLDWRLIRCLEVKDVHVLQLKDCYISGFDINRFSNGLNIVQVHISTISYQYNKTFESATFEDMPSLKYITIDRIRSSRVFNATFQNLPSLISLSIDDYNFTSFLQKPFQNLTSLSRLYLNRGKLSIFPEDIFFGLYNLQHLNLRSNLIESIHPQVFRNLTRLKVLDLSSNNIQSLPGDLFKGLSDLMYFFISDNKHLGAFPSGFLKGLSNLTWFAATGCSLSVIQENLFFDAFNLRDVEFDFNEIHSLPSKLFKNNKNLNFIVLRGNNIVTLPNEIFDGLTELFNIDLSSNNLETFPEISFRNSASCTLYECNLDLSYNRISVLSQDLFRNMSSLLHLNLSHNEINFLPENVFLPLDNLRKLDLSYNNFTEITEENPFGKCISLQYLRISNANLTKWPNINWTAHDLIEIDLSNNHFETVNLPIYSKNNLTVRLSNCAIKTISIDYFKYGFRKPHYDLRYNNITCDDEPQPLGYALNSDLYVFLEIFSNIKDLDCYEEENVLLDSRLLDVVRNYCPKKCSCREENNGVTVTCFLLKKFPVFLIENATSVDLSFNQISEIRKIDYETWKNVTDLYLSVNSLSVIPNDVLPPSIEFLDLRRNQLTKLPETLMKMIDDNPKFVIYLGNNNWSCDCNSSFTNEWLNRNRMKIMDFSLLSCRRNNNILLFSYILYSDNCAETSEVDFMSLRNVFSTEGVSPVNSEPFGFHMNSDYTDSFSSQPFELPEFRMATTTKVLSTELSSILLPSNTVYFKPSSLKTSLLSKNTLSTIPVSTENKPLKFLYYSVYTPSLISHALRSTTVSSSIKHDKSTSFGFNSYTDHTERLNSQAVSSDDSSSTDSSDSIKFNSNGIYTEGEISQEVIPSRPTSIKTMANEDGAWSSGWSTANIMVSLGVFLVLIILPCIIIAYIRRKRIAKQRYKVLFYSKYNDAYL